MNVWHVTLLSFYLACSTALAAYALHGLLMLALFRRRAVDVRAAQREQIDCYRAQTDEGAWPTVTVQLPLYNEAEVAERVIEACARLDYPQDRFEIQVLDDSSDESSLLVDAVVERLRAKGCPIHVLRRSDRVGYKAGALAAGMLRARGELLAIFDADFVPTPDFLRQAVPLLADAPEVACVQGRWAHLNRDESWLTRVQSVGIDGHFAVEQGARAWNGLLMNFNGTAGIWRASAIRESGGWSGDTLTEDLDLSYRAQLAGFTMVYSLDIACPAEIPSTVDALKSQQRRWAKGSIQTARKLLGPIWRAPIGLERKIAATFHLTHYSVSVLMTVLAVLTLPVLLWVPFMQLGHWMLAAWVIVLSSAAAPCINYLAAGRTLGHAGFTLRNIPGLVVLGSGLSINNASAVLDGLTRRKTPFVRTPKNGSSGQRKHGRYRPQLAPFWWLELSLGIYCGFTLIVYVSVSKWLIGMFLGFYTTGFLVLGWASGPLGARALASWRQRHESELEPPASSAHVPVPAASGRSLAEPAGVRIEPEREIEVGEIAVAKA